MDFLLQNKNHVDRLLEQALPSDTTPPERLHAAMRYSVLNGGKRIRASLCYAVAKLGRPVPEYLDQLAVAVELIHAYSLVHDDLPDMDNDELRRGQPTCHVAYDSATAILVGDALQSLGFEYLTHPHPDMPADIQLSIVRQLSQAIGSQGMAGGQSLDLLAEGSPPTRERLSQIHSLKTGALMGACIDSAAKASFLSREACQELASFGAKLGLAFQIMDDVLECVSTTTILGKPENSDLKNDKATYVKLMGLQAAREEAQALYDEALNHLAPFAEQALYLQEIAKFIVFRIPPPQTSE